MGNQMPLGTIIMHTGSTLPTGWMYCHGNKIELKDLRRMTNNNSLAQKSYDKLRLILGNRYTLPDLRDRFIFGSNGSDVNRKGKQDGHEHQVDIPKSKVKTSSNGCHTHQFPTHWYTRKFGHFLAPFNGVDVNGDNVQDRVLEDAGGHDHEVTVDIPPFSTDQNRAENRPAWYAVHFIMKVLL